MYNALSTLNTTNPQLLPGRCSIKGCPLLWACVHSRAGLGQINRHFFGPGGPPALRTIYIYSRRTCTGPIVRRPTGKMPGMPDYQSSPGSQCVCVCVHCCVCALWMGKCWAQILSMGHHTWSYVTSLSLIWVQTIMVSSWVYLGIFPL